MPPSEHPFYMPEEDARHRKALHKTVKLITFQNKILCKRPVCCQIETEENDVIVILMCVTNIDV